MSEVVSPAPAWQEVIFQSMKHAGVAQVAYVPDAGHAHVIRRVQADPGMRDIVLTTEEEGVALATGAWLGGQRAVLLMQSSGVGNCINMFSLLQSCRIPFLTLVTMRGEYAEFNPWQTPMSKATQGTMELMGIRVQRADRAGSVRHDHLRQQRTGDHRFEDHRGLLRRRDGSRRSRYFEGDRHRLRALAHGLHQQLELHRNDRQLVGLGVV